MTPKEISQRIKQKRLQMLVHSFLYYDLDTSLIDDYTWSMWAKELEELQDKYPEISKQTPYLQGFENWDGSTGAFLPYRTPFIMNTAYYLLKLSEHPITKPPEYVGKSLGAVKSTPKTNTVRKRTLF